MVISGMLPLHSTKKQQSRDVFMAGMHSSSIRQRLSEENDFQLASVYYKACMLL